MPYLACSRNHGAAAGFELARIGASDRPVVDDAGLGDMQRRDARGVRLVLAELFGADPLHAREAVGPAEEHS